MRRVLPLCPEPISEGTFVLGDSALFAALGDHKRSEMTRYPILEPVPRHPLFAFQDSHVVDGLHNSVILQEIRLDNPVISAGLPIGRIGPLHTLVFQRGIP